MLSLPVANSGEGFTPLELSFFTATSAVTVTGHTVLDTSTYWTPFGQAVIFFLMLVGGLGFMLFATIALLFVGHHPTLTERMITRDLMSDTVGVQQMWGLRQLGRRFLLFVFVVYGVGAAVIFVQINEVDGLGLGRSIWGALFLAVSAFNNAGLNILPESPLGSSLARFGSDPGLLISVIGLMVMGGLGWTALVELYRRRHFRRFTLDTKMVLVGSICLWVTGAIAILFLEFANPGTLGGLGWADKVVSALFSSVSARTAGLSVLDFSQAQEATLMAYTGLMFVGGAAGSAAGGIKIVTFAVIVAAVFSTLRDRHQVEAFGREIGGPQLHRAMAVALLAGAVIWLALAILSTTDGDIPFLPLMFDTVSAFGTVGASTGTIVGMSLTGKAVIMAAMFLGRLAPLLLAINLFQSSDQQLYDYAKERVNIA